MINTTLTHNIQKNWKKLNSSTKYPFVKIWPKKKKVTIDQNLYEGCLRLRLQINWRHVNLQHSQEKDKKQRYSFFFFSHLNFLVNQKQTICLYTATVWVSMIICFNFYLFTKFSALDVHAKLLIFHHWRLFYWLIESMQFMTK